jgi:hypothetical protein
VLSDLLQASNKVMLRSDELATFLGAFERYQKAGSINANRAHMLALYDGGPRRIDRVLRGKMFVENWSAVPVGHIQPAKVRPLVDGLSDDGLLQRFMIVMPPLTVTEDPDDDDVRSDWEAIDHYTQMVEILFNMRPPQTLGKDGEPEYCVVEAGEDVHATRRRLFRLVERIEADLVLPAALKEASSKWRGLLARLSLLFHCIELAEAKQAGESSDPAAMRTLNASTVEKACNFIVRIVVPSTFRFHTEIGSTGMAEIRARWIAGFILSRKLEDITAREIGRAYGAIRGKTAEILAAMELLDHAGWVYAEPGLKPGVKPSAWDVNPRVHTIFAAQAAAEKVRRDAARERVHVSIAELAVQSVSRAN